ncbi:hypothetical protein BST27_01890 [Mycobacterium intermedium]|uniref:Cytochrome n=1 Tax=Mycobacterium intermedium TaxID=28445 RepID=A0A1E3SMB2_MYCIE|nr:hypothetical protein BHQ20_04040 [Mycobacterium intermedium]OPE51931.1 hypothetical protein BV508_04280 [Mycobacterium intermedium]ORB10348.1 hypothetical protein BST27_01890 [Mycobacterium intermedium]
MTASTDSRVHFDPYDVALIADPYPTFQRLRDEAPLSHRPEYDSYAVGRFAVRPYPTFDVGTHSYLGSALARLKGRIALEETLKRFPESETDLARAILSPTSTVRGAESVPTVVL